MSNGLSINGTATGGTIYRLNDSSQLDAVRKGIDKDGRDQVVVKAGSDIYVIEGDSLNLGGLYKGSAGKPAELSLKLGDKTIKADMIQFSDEVSSGWDGVKKAGTAISFGWAGLLLSEVVSKAATGKVLVPATPRNSAIILGVMATALAAGAIYGNSSTPVGESRVAGLGTRVQ